MVNGNKSVIAFRKAKKGYDREQVDEFVHEVEVKLQEKASQLEELQKRVDELENGAVVVPQEPNVEECFDLSPSAAQKAALYDKLMAKMEGDYTNLLTPAIAKAKAVEEKAKNEYAVRMDQARHTADGIYAEAAEKITGAVSNAVDANMGRIYDLMDNFIYSKSFLGRVDAFVNGCKVATAKTAESIYNLQKNTGKAAGSVKKTFTDIRDELKDKVEARKKALDTYNEQMKDVE